MPSIPMKIPIIPALVLVAMVASLSAKEPAQAKSNFRTVAAAAFDAGKGYYLDQGKWLAINPDQHKTAEARTVFRLPEGRYDITLQAVGENDGGSSYEVKVGDELVGKHTAPLAKKNF